MTQRLADRGFLLALSSFHIEDGDAGRIGRHRKNRVSPFRLRPRPRPEGPDKYISGGTYVPTSRGSTVHPQYGWRREHQGGMQLQPLHYWLPIRAKPLRPQLRPLKGRGQEILRSAVLPSLFVFRRLFRDQARHTLFIILGESVPITSRTCLIFNGYGVLVFS